MSITKRGALSSLDVTEAVAGPTDYHLGGFRAMPLLNFKVQTTRPHMLATRCHMLAMYVILENHMSMLCDYPEAYEGEPGFDFIRQIPTVWDQTVVPGAATGEWVSIARRKGTDWYIGTITNSTARQVSISFNFLPVGNYTATIYKDGEDAVNNPNNLIKETKIVSSSDKLIFDLPAGGGEVIRLQIIEKI